MEIYIPWLATILFGYFAISSLFAGLKSHKKDEEREFDEVFSYDVGILNTVGIFFTFVLWGSEKLFPQRFQLIVFRVVALSTSLLMVGLIYLCWHLFS